MWLLWRLLMRIGRSWWGWGRGLASLDAHLSDDEAVAKMGHPVSSKMQYPVTKKNGHPVRVPIWFADDGCWLDAGFEPLAVAGVELVGCFGAPGAGVVGVDGQVGFEDRIEELPALFDVVLPGETALVAAVASYAGVAACLRWLHLARGYRGDMIAIVVGTVVWAALSGGVLMGLGSKLPRQLLRRKG